LDDLSLIVEQLGVLSLRASIGAALTVESLRTHSRVTTREVLQLNGLTIRGQQRETGREARSGCWRALQRHHDLDYLAEGLVDLLAVKLDGSAAGSLTVAARETAFLEFDVACVAIP
jgi:hypothetical protein